MSSHSLGMVLLVAGFLVMLAGDAAAQEEIYPFKLTDVSGVLSMRYLFDERRDESFVGAPFASSTRLQEEIFIRTRSYVYHPALLEMIISGGPMFVQNEYDTDGSKSSGRETLFGYDVALNFLARKAYPFTVFFREDHPEVATGYSGRFLTRTNQYGIHGRLRQPLTPINIVWSASHQDSLGSGFGASVDNNVDKAGLTTSLPYKRVHNLRLDLNWLNVESRNGSPGLPIRETSSKTFTSRLKGKNVFGSNRQIRLNQHLLQFKQETAGAASTEVDTMTYTGDLRWKKSDRLNSYGSYKFYDSQRNRTWQRSQELGAGTKFRVRQGLNMSGEVNSSSYENPVFSRDRVGGSISANYFRDLTFGRLGISGTFRRSHSDQQSSSDTSDVFDESVFLTGVSSVALNQSFVVASTVIITNIDRTQTFVEDIDYRLFTIGSTTTVERLVTGNILDGQEVLVSYGYLTGGTVEHATTSQSIGANLGLFSRANLFLRLNNTEHEILSGVATTPLNDATRVEVGGQIDYPLPRGWSVGGDIRYTKQNEEISPFVRTSYDSYVRSARYWNTRVRIGVHWETVDYETSREDVDRVLYSFSLESRLPGGLFLTYRGTQGGDSGGSLIRDDERHNLRLDWRYRLVVFSLNAVRVDTAQGASRRESTRVTAIIRRFF